MQQWDVYTVRRFGFTLLTACVGGFLFQGIHIPVPWLLGPMIAVLIGANIRRRFFYWPVGARNVGMMVVGYTIGLSLTTAALHEIVRQIPSMFLLTVLLMVLCLGIAYVISKLSDGDYRSSLLACIPGGLTQVVLLAEETKGVNMAVVTITQIMRLMMIVTFIPIIVTLPLFHDGNAVNQVVSSQTQTDLWAGLFPGILLFAVVAIIFAYLGNKIHFPTAILLGPAIGTALLQAFGMTGPVLPSFMVHLAQLLIGAHVGMMLRTDQITRKGRTFSLAIGSGLLLMIFGGMLSFLLTVLQPVSNATGLLSMAPGGMDQMGIIAHEIHADLSIVSGYQLFRSFFIYFLITPLLKWLFNKAT